MSWRILSPTFYTIHSNMKTQTVVLWRNTSHLQSNSAYRFHLGLSCKIFLKNSVLLILDKCAVPNRQYPPIIGPCSFSSFPVKKKQAPFQWHNCTILLKRRTQRCHHNPATIMIELVELLIFRSILSAPVDGATEPSTSPVYGTAPRWPNGGTNVPPLQKPVDSTARKTRVFSTSGTNTGIFSLYNETISVELFSKKFC